MSFLHPTRVFTRVTNRGVATCHASTLRSFSGAIRYYSLESSQGYGDGKGDPKGENPLEQGPSSDDQHDAEHPGPAPPPEGQVTGGATRADSGTKDPSEVRASSGGSRSKDAKEGGPKPKISDMKIPNEGGSAKQAEVDQHNKEFEKRYDRAAKASDDKVDKKFWSGQGGADGKP